MKPRSNEITSKIASVCKYVAQKALPCGELFELNIIPPCFAHNKVDPGSKQCVQNKKVHIFYEEYIVCSPGPHSLTRAKPPKKLKAQTSIFL